MSSLNRVSLMGRLGADPEIRRMNSGDPIVSLRLATSETWRDKNSGEKKERTEWHTVVIFNQGLCTIAEQYLKKGHLVFIEGQLATRKWQDQAGQDRYSTEVVLRPLNGNLILMPNGQGRQGANGPDDYGADTGSSQSSTTRGGNSYSQQSGGSSGSFGRDLDDQIPF